jgi:hypothetical protein
VTSKKEAIIPVIFPSRSRNGVALVERPRLLHPGKGQILFRVWPAVHRGDLPGAFPVIPPDEIVARYPKEGGGLGVGEGIVPFLVYHDDPRGAGLQDARQASLAFHEGRLRSPNHRNPVIEEKEEDTCAQDGPEEILADGSPHVKERMLEQDPC